MSKMIDNRIIAIAKEKSYNMSVSFRTVLYLMNDCFTNDFAYSSHSQNIIELKADIERACRKLKINTNKTKKTTLSQAKKIAEYLNNENM